MAKKIFAAGDELTAAEVNAEVKYNFGGDGSDGALTISSGTTTIDLGNAAVVIKQYTSISITGTGKLAFSNPNTNGTTIILKSQGNVTLTSSQAPMIDAAQLGGAGGAAVVGNNGNQNGNAGADGKGILITVLGGGANRASSNVGGLATLKPGLTTLGHKFFMIAPGSGGGSGPSGGGPDATTLSGAGGRGGGALVIECAGAWNFTTASGISVAAGNGGNASAGSDTQYGISGGSGGGGGCLLVLYGSLTANSGTVTVSGGSGGNAVSAGIGSGLGSPWSAAGGGSIINQGTTSAQGTDTTAPNGVSGGAGVAIIALNEDFA